MGKINNYPENTSANNSDVFIEETSNGTRKITFSTILNGILSKFLKSTTKSSLTAASKGSTSSREYAVGLDNDGDMSVNVPWTDTKTTVVNNLTSTSTTSALSAAQGKYLKGEIDDLNSALSNTITNKGNTPIFASTGTAIYNLVENGFDITKPIFGFINSNSIAFDFCIIPYPGNHIANGYSAIATQGLGASADITIGANRDTIRIHQVFVNGVEYTSGATLHIYPQN